MIVSFYYFMYFEEISHYSGVISLCIIWSSIIMYPAYMLSIDAAKETISQAVLRDRKVHDVVMGGLCLRDFSKCCLCFI